MSSIFANKESCWPVQPTVEELHFAADDDDDEEDDEDDDELVVAFNCCIAIANHCSSEYASYDVLSSKVRSIGWLNPFARSS